MFAVIRCGGKQYKVAKQDVITVERLPAAVGDNIALEEVLMIAEANGASIGTPTLTGATVRAEVLEQTLAPKIIVFKKKRRKGYRRTQGHRQAQTVLRITDITSGAKKAAARRKPEKTAAKRKPEKTAAKRKAEKAAPAASAKTAAKAKAEKAEKAASATAAAGVTKPAAPKAKADAPSKARPRGKEKD